jgi:hypothetical protein
MKEQEIPSEVIYVSSLIQSGQPVGTKTYDFIQNTIKKYPQYFPWETKYASIPQEVHDAYRKEVGGSDAETLEDMIKEFESKSGVIPSGSGMISQIMNADFSEAKTTNLDFTKADLEAFINSILESDKEYAKEKEREKEIWDKHYKKYGLKYR